MYSFILSNQLLINYSYFGCSFILRILTKNGYTMTQQNRRYLTCYFLIKRIKDSKIKWILHISKSNYYNVIEHFTVFFDIPIGQGATHS